MTVSAFLTYVNETFKAIWDSTEVATEGEVSGYRLSQGQWITFDLKDSESLVNVFLPAWKLKVPLQDGLRVRVFGCPRVYPKYGKFSFSAERVELAGEGSLRKALTLMRQKLEAEGLFDPTRKRSLPRFPLRIALIASRESAAYGDFIRILNERWGGLEIDFYHVLVQGDRAAERVVKAIEMANTSRLSGRYDALVLTRGGGSLEELMPFNDERVARALYASKIPTLVGIGHERDITFAEEVADVRASTPTDCARRLVPDRADVLYEIATTQEQIVDTFHRHLDDWSMRALRVTDHVLSWLVDVRSRSDVTINNVDIGLRRWLTRLQEHVSGSERLFRSFDPKSVMRRGYTLVRDNAGRVRTSVQSVMAGAALSVEWYDGSAETIVRSIKKNV